MVGLLTFYAGLTHYIFFFLYSIYIYLCTDKKLNGTVSRETTYLSRCGWNYLSCLVTRIKCIFVCVWWIRRCQILYSYQYIYILTRFVYWHLGCVLFEHNWASFAGLVGTTVVTRNNYGCRTCLSDFFCFLEFRVDINLFIYVFFFFTLVF